MSFDSNSKRMISMGIVGMNLNDPAVRFFDIELVVMKFENQSFTGTEKTIM